MPDREEILRRLTLGDEAMLDSLIARRRSSQRLPGLDHIGEALVKIGALAATGESETSWQHAIDDALDAGLTHDEIIDALIVLAPFIGLTRLEAIAPRIASALGYDLAVELEAHETPARRRHRHAREGDPWATT